MYKADLLLFIDHDNINFSEVGIKKILNIWLDFAINNLSLNSISDIKIRIYGGWNIEGKTSEKREQATVFYQENCPSIYKFKNHFFRISIEFADNLVIDQNYFIQNTYVKRKAQKNVIVSSPNICTKEGCELKKIKKWINNNKACTTEGCEHKFSEIFFRPEQKQVDIHLAIDLVSVIEEIDGCKSISLLSNDIDFIPALVYLSKKSKTNNCVIREKSITQYCDEYLIKNNTIILKY